MENNNNKKQQNFSRAYNTKNSQSTDSKRKTDLQTSNCAFPRVARRRDQQPPTNRNERYSKQHPSKQRPNVDKRPPPRGVANSGGGGSSYFAGRESSDSNVNTNDSELTSSAGLVDNNYDDEVGYDDDDFVVCDNVHFKGLDSRPLHLSGKRKNLNHLLNFRYVFRERGDYIGGARGIASGVNGSGGGSVGSAKRNHHQHKYNKEQFLQANFQFVIKSNVKPNLITSPDSIVDWSLIEQINIQTTEEPQCPICLYPPVAAKLTRCGHAYCWPCILHYLALNDKSWRKCPICYEAIHVSDLKSTAILQQQALNVGDVVSFQLMRRKKGSFFVEKFSNMNTACIERYPLYSGKSDMKQFSKFLLAKRSDILSIIEREYSELMADDDTTCPEYIFVQQALNLLKERREKLGETQLSAKDDAEVDDEDVTVESAIDANGVKVNETIDSLDPSFKNDDAAEELQHTAIGIETDFNTVDSGAMFNFDTQSVSSVELNASAQQKYYYFYQSIDGQNIFLHPLNVKMLQACYGALEFAPLSIKASIIQKECHTMDENLRRKFTCLGHLPLTCQFSVVEVDLQPPMINTETLKLFKDDIRQRQLDRERRDRQEKKRERKIAAINDRQMGKLIAKTANINLTSAQEFPACGFGFDLSPPNVLPDFNLVTSSATNVVSKANETISAVNVAGSPPGPSYSSIITSRDNSQVNDAGLFPELSLGAKPNKKSIHATTTWPSNNNNSSNKSKRLNAAPELLESDSGDTPKRMGATFGDVMEQAIARRKTGGGGGNAANNEAGICSNSNSNNNNNTSSNGFKKREKREKKKMVPLFASNVSGLKNFN